MIKLNQIVTSQKQSAYKEDNIEKDKNYYRKFWGYNILWARWL